MKIAALFAVLMMFNDGKEHNINVFSQFFILSKNQCLVDYAGFNYHFFVVINFTQNKKNQSIISGKTEVLKMCGQCSEYLIACVE